MLLVGLVRHIRLEGRIVVKLALIAPYEMLAQSGAQRYHLMLPHLRNHRMYDDHFGRLCKDPDRYVILDNGVAEGVTLRDSELLAVAGSYQVDEVVAPDVLSNARGTFNRSSQFFRHVNRFGPDDLFKFGYVVQGRTIDSCYQHMNWVLGEEWSDLISVWHIPRALIQTAMDPFARMNLARWIYSMDQKQRPVHLLGMSPGFPQELKLIRSYAGPSGTINIRSLDTSLPYVYALHNAYVEADNNPVLKRPAKYFETPIMPSTRSIALANCRTLKRWANGD